MIRLPYIIGEFGSCHEEILEHALELIRVAAEAGCSAVKGQFWSSPERMRQRRNVTNPEAFQRGSINETWFPTLKEAAHTAGLDFMCTAFLPEDVALVAQHVDHFKVASFEHMNRPLLYKVLQAVKGTEKKIFFSTGLPDGRDISWSPRLPLNPGAVISMHCVSSYPCPPEQTNLAAIKRGHGFSDHTGIHFTGGLAVAAGADYLEVHFRLDETSKACADFPHSLTPDMLRQYISFAHVAWQMRGDGQRAYPQQAEIENVSYRVGVTVE